MHAADALTAALVLLRPEEASRNRYPHLHAGPEGREARRRAARIRLALGHLQGFDGPPRRLEGSDGPLGYLLRYELTKLSFVRETRLLAVDAAVLRVALASRHIRLLPVALRPSDEDRACTERLLGAFRAARDALPLHR